MSIESDIERIAVQEKRLQFDHFDSAIAWDIGGRLKRSLSRGKALPRLLDEQENVGYAFVGFGDCDMVGVTGQNKQP